MRVEDCQQRLAEVEEGSADDQRPFDGVDQVNFCVPRQNAGTLSEFINTMNSARGNDRSSCRCNRNQTSGQRVGLVPGVALEESATLDDVEPPQRLSRHQYVSPRAMSLPLASDGGNIDRLATQHPRQPEATRRRRGSPDLRAR